MMPFFVPVVRTDERRCTNTYPQYSISDFADSRAGNRQILSNLNRLRRDRCGLILQPIENAGEPVGWFCPRCDGGDTPPPFHTYRRGQQAVRMYRTLKQGGAA